MSENFPAIPFPSLSLNSHQSALMAMKEMLEILAGLRGQGSNTALTQASVDALNLYADTQIEAATVWEKIADVEPTAVAAIDIEWTLGQYRAVDLILTGILPAAVSVTANLMARARSGGSYLSGATAYNTQALAQEVATVNGQSFDASGWYLQRGGTAAALDNYSGRFLIDPGVSGGEAGFTGQERHSSNAGSRAQRLLVGSLVNTGDVDGLRLFWESGTNFTATGRVTVLGLKA